MWLNIIGYIGGILLAVCAIPEVIRTYNDKRCHLGWPFLLLWFVGEIFMEIYAIALMDYPLIFNYSFNLITTAFLLYYKFKTPKSICMKYLLKILLISLSAIPFFIWEGLVTVWTFRTDNLIKLKKEVSYEICTNYCKAFNIHKPPTQ